MMDTQSTAEPLTNGPDKTRHTHTHTHSMDMKQILLFGLFLVPVWTSRAHRCHEAGELEEAVKRRLKTLYPLPLSADNSTGADPGSHFDCPVELYRHQPRHSDVSVRSLSPWRYVRVTKEDHFPSTYVEAQCLCTGCILIQDKPGQEERPLPEESFDYNSKPLKQSRVFLKKERCEGTQMYHLRPVTVEVTVGCTCVRALTSSSS